MFVNILHGFDYDLFSYISGRTLCFPDVVLYENSTEHKIWDVVIVFESFDAPLSVGVKDGGLIFISGEPPEFSILPRSFIEQFDIVYSSTNVRSNRPLIVGAQIYNNWHFGLSHSMKAYQYTFDELSCLEVPRKTKALSIVSSNLRRTPEHRARFDLYRRLEKEFGNSIGMYGRGTNPIDDKRQALLPYRFHIAIENCSVNGVWTEKLADSFLGYCCPVYFGCPNVDDFFPERSVIKINPSNIETVLTVVESLLVNSEVSYKRRLEGILEARSLLFKEYNVLALAFGVFPNLREPRARKIRPASEFAGYKLQGAKASAFRKARKVLGDLLKGV